MKPKRQKQLEAIQRLERPLRRGLFRGPSAAQREIHARRCEEAKRLRQALGLPARGGLAR